MISALRGSVLPPADVRDALEEYRPLLRRLLARGLETSAVDYSAARLRGGCASSPTAAAGRERGRADHAVDCDTGAGRPVQHGEHGVPGAVDILRPADHHHPVETGGVGPADGPADHLAAPFCEERLLAAARWCERVLDVHLAPPV
ncbi:hypothetical protein GBAR_LOCUS24380 [Geodia barretti]|uniref:Uncharacterized protein n=1 Tax=Geodia barretti TaxID=519541 RepID=A0AA35T8V7_GEOBA|nr:hypothetical protein GBAR_LOCUS24380 [Geodia barretti]